MATRRNHSKAGADLVLHMRGLELARAHDGFLRGAAEPVVLLALYALEPVPHLLTRALWRFRAPTQKVPTTVRALRGPRPVQQGAALDAGAGLVLVAVGMEEDSGEDIKRVYGALERAAALTLWRMDDGGAVPTPQALHAAAPGLASPARVRVLSDDVDLGMNRKVRDDFVGACAVAFQRARAPAEHRLHLADDSARNDWTALLQVREG